MKTCTKCGGFDLYKDGRCRPCISAAVSARRAKNPDKYNASRLAWARAHPDKNREIQAKYRDANRENINKIELARKASAAWAKANPEARRIHNQNRRARKREVGGKLSNGLSAKLFTLQRGKCACCGVKLDDGSHLDHVIPLALVGPNEDWNMQLLCGPCNMSKGAKHPVDFMQQRGYLI